MKTRIAGNRAAAAGRAMQIKIKWRSKFMLALGATAILCLFGGIAAPSTVSANAILGMLPYFVVLAVSSVGQHLAIQQRGLDLSAAGVMSFAGVIVSALPPLDANGILTLGYVLLALLMGLLAGAANGYLIAILKVPALITTLGTNALFQGAAILVSQGHAQQVPPPLNNFALGLSAGIPNTVWLLLVFAVVAIFFIDGTTIGRRFVACAVSPRATANLGIRVKLYRIGTYAVAGFCYALAAVILAGCIVSPPVFAGTPYMLATIAAVVVGGNSIAGGDRASIVATILGAFFLVYLGQLLVSLGYSEATQNLLQAVIVLCSAALPALYLSTRTAWAAR